ncbi:MAG: glycosyltransferase [Bdellovibrionales bacterium]|nr:glycosyltransferase [Bdellovibrionales bacterium]
MARSNLSSIEDSNTVGIGTRVATSVQFLVPIYNEGANVTRLYERLIAEGISFDLLTFVYDFDGDTSLPFIAELTERDPRVVADKNCYGRGVVNALRWGFAHANPGPVVVTMGDNSDKLSILPEMLSLWERGACIVCPSRYMPGGMQHGGPPLKTFLSRTAGVLLKLVGFPTADATNNYKLYDGEWLRRQTIESTGGFEIALELCYRAYAQGQRIVELPTEWWDRTAGESNFKLWAWLPKYLRWYFRALGAIAQQRLGLATRETN